MSPSANLLSRILLALEDWRVVVACIIVTLVVRLLYMLFRRANPLPPPLVSKKTKTTSGKPPRPKDYGYEIIDTVLIAFILVFGIVRPFLLQTFFIPSASMEPTLLGPYDPALAGDRQYDATLVKTGPKRGGDMLIANRFVLRFRAPQRGEIIIFEPSEEAIVGSNPGMIMRKWMEENPQEAQTKLLPAWNAMRALNKLAPRNSVQEMLEYNDVPPIPQRRDAYIKRVIGIPGDRIRIDAKQHAVYLNGSETPLNEPYIVPDAWHKVENNFPRMLPKPESFPVPPTPNADGMVSGEAVKNYLDNVERWLYFEWYPGHVLYPKCLQPHIDGAEFVVPPNAVFMMGDNRGGSFDSRFWGVVPFSHIKGRAVAVFFPFNRMKLL